MSHPYYEHGWRRGVVVSGVRQWTKLTHVGSGYNWDWWPSSSGYTISSCNQPTRSTQPCIPLGWLNRVPASAGVKAGMSPLLGGRWYCVIPCGMWVPVAVRRVANCYTPFTLLFYFTVLTLRLARPVGNGNFMIAVCVHASEVLRCNWNFVLIASLSLSLKYKFVRQSI